VKKLGDLGDVGCSLALGADLLRPAAIALLPGKPAAFSVVKMAQLRLEQEAGGPVLVEGGGGRTRDPDGRVIAG
jgi:hypothetical protein